MDKAAKKHKALPEVYCGERERKEEEEEEVPLVRSSRPHTIPFYTTYYFPAPSWILDAEEQVCL